MLYYYCKKDVCMLGGTLLQTKKNIFSLRKRGKVFMIELIEIYTYLISNGWKELGDGEFASKDWMFKLNVRYDDYKSKILIKTAILPLFDRWANSGSRDYFDTVEDAIKFLKGKYVLSAFREINGMLEETVNNDGIIDAEGYKLILSIIGIFCK